MAQRFLHAGTAATVRRRIPATLELGKRGQLRAEFGRDNTGI